jgi:light-regulated signal transduction histidine kinase (bacteriophytochrome)
MSGSGDDKLGPQLAQDSQASLQRQNERLQLLLNLTNRITSHLDLREVLRAISANFRELMRCDGAVTLIRDHQLTTGGEFIAINFKYLRSLILLRLVLASVTPPKGESNG